MTPRGWVKDTLNRWPAGHHVAEGATHLAAALKEIARLRADASAASPSCDRCQSAHCCSVRDESAKTPLCVTDPDGSMPLWMPWTNADVQARVNPLHAEIDRLRAEAGRVVVPELRGLTDEQAQAIADTFAIETTKYTVFRVWAIAQDQVACNGSVPAGRVLKDGEVAVAGSCVWERVTEGLSLWSSTCGHEWEFLDAGPEENEVKFCPFCGGRMEVDALRAQAKGEKDV